MKVIELDRDERPIPEGEGHRSGVLLRDENDRLGIAVIDGARSLGMRLSGRQALELAQHLFVNALRMEAKTENGRIAVGVAARMMLHRTQRVAQELRDEEQRDGQGDS